MDFLCQPPASTSFVSPVPRDNQGENCIARIASSRLSRYTPVHPRPCGRIWDSGYTQPLDFGSSAPAWAHLAEHVIEGAVFRFIRARVGAPPSVCF
jgi:hypothetical protein